MRNHLIILIVILFIRTGNDVYGQKIVQKKNLSFSLGMGIVYLSSPSFTDFLKNEIPYFTSDSIKTYSAGVEFFGSLEYEYTKSISASFDYSYYLRSSNYTFSYYVFDYTITSHQPSIMVYYNLNYTGFKFKMGAGGGYHFHSLVNNINASNKESYSANGGSIRAEFMFAPALSNKLAAYVSVFYTGNFTSSLKNSDGVTLKSSSTGKEVNLGSYGPGARLGFTFLLN